MTKLIFSSKIIINLIELTKANKCDWISMGILKQHLRKEGLSLSDIAYLHTYLKHLQKDRFIFECDDTYITYYLDDIYILSKNKYSYDYRLDTMSMEGADPKWSKIHNGTAPLLRLRNAVVLTNNTDDCENLIAAISSNCTALSL